LLDWLRPDDIYWGHTRYSEKFLHCFNSSDLLILEIRKLSHREKKKPGYGHTAEKWQSWDSNLRQGGILWHHRQYHYH
jgi:hypothetical protein